MEESKDEGLVTPIHTQAAAQNKEKKSLFLVRKHPPSTLTGREGGSMDRAEY